jgi:PAS domain S-box-containing protein
MTTKTLKILVVEDNPADVLLVESLLKEAKYARFEITHVESLEEAEQTLGKQSFEIILLDLGLPDSQGIETFFRIRRLASDIPIVVLTGLYDEAIAIEAVSNGAQDYICKDRWDAQLIVRSINQAIERHQVLQECKQANETSQAALKALREAQQRLELAIDGADLIFWERNFVTDELALGGLTAKILGFSPGDIVDFEHWKSRVHCDDVRRFLAAVDAHVKGETPSYETEYRARSESGEWIWILSRGKIVERDATGKALRMAGTFVDITSRKLAEEALRQSENLFRAVFEGAEDYIFIKDRDLRYVQVNPALAKLVNREPSDFVGRQAKDVLGARVDKQTRSMELRALEGQSIDGEQTVAINGIPVVFSYSTTPLRDADGNVAGIFCIARDITDRQQEEISLSPSSEDYPSKAMRAVLGVARRIALQDSVVLLLGESGSGKDYLAKYIHDRSHRKNAPYFSVNCAAIVPELAESELFGHERGAFTGAVVRKRGMVELAEGGTLLLNEIGDLSLPLQAKLLTFLDTKKLTRVGGEKEILVNARLIAATNMDLEQEVRAGRFRKDLFYRLNVIRIEVPPLRKRLEDIPVLAGELLSKLRDEFQLHEDPVVDPEAMIALKKYHWPGNVRELRNVLERALILSQGKGVTLDRLELRGEARPAPEGKNGPFSVSFPTRQSLNEITQDLKRYLVNEALRMSNGSRQEAARLLGISRHSLKHYMKTLGYEEE